MNPTTAPKVLVQILHYRDLADTLDCLASVFASDYPNYQVVVVDNTGAASPAAPELKALEAEGRLALLKPAENTGFTGGHNLAFDWSLAHGADAVWVLNNDTVVQRDTMSRLMQQLAASPAVGAITPLIVRHGSGDIQNAGCIIDPQLLELTAITTRETLAHHQQAGQDFCFWGTAVLVRAEVLRRVGYFDADLFAYYEDTDLSLRILRAGYKILITPDAEIMHKVVKKPATGLRQPHFYYYMARNRLLFSRKHAVAPHRWAVFRRDAVDILELLMSCLKQHDEKCTGAVLDGLYHGLRRRTGVWRQDGHMPAPVAWVLKRGAWPLYKLLRPA